MSSAAERAARVRRGAGWFAPGDRGLVSVRGGDRVRWANGMLSNDVSALVPDPARSGCQALLLTAQGRIVADLHVYCRPEELWLETDRGAVAEVMERLARFVIADDVELRDESEAWRRFALEGPRAPEILARASGARLELAPDCGAEIRVGSARAVVCAWGWSGEAAYQLFVPGSEAGLVEEAFAGAGREVGLERADAATLEVLRIEAGTPRFGSELGQDVLPSETGLVGRAVSLTKGCYTGQEIVARMESRGAAAHRLVGFRLEGDGDTPGAGTAVCVGQRRVGELTSACHSALEGEIGLGYLRRAHAEPGREVSIDGRRARVAGLPFVSASE